MNKAIRPLRTYHKCGAGVVVFSGRCAAVTASGLRFRGQIAFFAARAGAEDRFEAMGEDFFAKVRAAYLERARRRPERFLIVNAELAPELVFDAILRKVSPWL